MIKVAGDSGSEHGPADIWIRYTGNQASLRLEYASGDVPATGIGERSQTVIVTMRDPYDPVVYRGEGGQTCST